MLEVRFSGPAPGLDRFVRCYVQREVRIHGTPVVHPVPARAATMLEFDFGDPVDVVSIDRRWRDKSPLFVVVGPRTSRNIDLHLSGTLKAFVIMFRPDGLQRLFGLPTAEISDRSFDAPSVLGSYISQAGQILGEAPSFEARVRFANEWLFRQSLRAGEVDAISEAANRMILSGGRADLMALADSVGLSSRQFARRFTRQIGMRPKLFARIARFEAALEHKAFFALKSWTEIAHEFGYYDQMHMVHDFAEFTGETPGGILNHLEAVFVEPIKRMRLSATTGNAIDRPRLIL
jgi:AraC-like DNA-binding protein